jgi:hypothetical protein
MSQVIILTVAAGLVGLLSKWDQRNHPSAVHGLRAVKAKTAAKKVERSAESVEAAIKALMVAVADEQRGVRLARQP